MISILQLGTIDYATSLRLQQKLVDLRKEGRVGDVLLLLEHPPVITLGRNAKPGNVLASIDRLRQRGVEVFECDRGGDVTFHGPGQIVGYPIFDLRRLAWGEAGPEEAKGRRSLGVIEYVRRLEEVLIRTCADFRISCERIAGLTGVWTSLSEGVVDDQDSSKGLSRSRKSQSAKIAAIGVHISRGVTSHGFALNVNTDLDYFNMIVPCGIVSKPVTSMATELGESLRLNDVAQALVRNFGTVFGSQVSWLESIEGLLTEQVDVPARPPEELRRLRGEEETFWA